MKLKLILIFIVLFVFAQNSFAQTDYRGKLEFNLSVDQTEWYIGSQVTAKITVKNISDEKLELTLMPKFSLVKKNLARGEFLHANTYSSDEKFDSPTVFSLTRLNKGESQTVEFEMSKVGWTCAMDSVIGGADWYSRVPKGEYEFYYWFDFVLDDNEDTPQYDRISSNRITVNLNSEK